MSATEVSNPRSVVMSADSRWIRRVPRQQPVVRLICLPYGGGGASIFQGLAALAPDSIEIAAVQLPGREDRSREDPPEDLDALVSACSVALRPYCTMPYVFYGHCAGALLAYEIAQTMGSRFGLWPERLIAAAQPAPHLPPREPLLHEMDDEQLLETINQRGGLPEAVARHTELVEFLLSVLRSDFTLWERYEYVKRDPLPFPVTSIRGKQDDVMGPEATAPWSEHTTAGHTDLEIDGGHYFINELSERGASILAGAVLGDRPR